MTVTAVSLGPMMSKRGLVVLTTATIVPSMEYADEKHCEGIIGVGKISLI